MFIRVHNEPKYQSRLFVIASAIHGRAKQARGPDTHRAQGCTTDVCFKASNRLRLSLIALKSCIEMREIKIIGIYLITNSEMTTHVP
jgi:hypothetical protein